MWNLALQLLEDFQHMRGGKSPKLGGGFKYFLFSPRKFGEDFQFDSYFSNGLVQPQPRKVSNGVQILYRFQGSLKRLGR